MTIFRSETKTTAAVLWMLALGIVSGCGQSSATALPTASSTEPATAVANAKVASRPPAPAAAAMTPVLGEHGFEGVSLEQQGTLAAITGLFPGHPVIRGKMEVPAVGADESDSHNEVIDVILIGAPGKTPDQLTALAWIEPDLDGRKPASIHLQQSGVRTVHGVEVSDPAKRLVRDDVAVSCRTVYMDEEPTVRCSLGALSPIVYHVSSNRTNMLPEGKAAQRKWLARNHVIEEIVWGE